jgi:putative membrane protein
MMVRDHTMANDELKQIASRYSISMPAQVDEKHLDTMNRLSKLRGADFDREFIKAMVDDHENAVDRLQTRTSEDRFGENKGQVKPESSDKPAEASLNQWAAKALPVVRHHLDEAKRIDDSLGKRLTSR